MAKGLWVVLNVDNVEKSLEFYKALGFRPKSEKMDMPGMPAATMGTLENAGSGLVFWNKNVVPPDQPADTRAWVSGELGKGVLFTLGVSDARKFWTNAQKLRAEVEQELRDQPWGGREFTLVDPDGYVINISDRFPGASPPKKPKARAAKPKSAKKGGKGKRR